MQTSTNSYGFTFNGHHSSEFDLKVLSNKGMSLPAKTKVTTQLPYANGVIDLSNVYGANNYGERTITFPCTVPWGFNNAEDLYLLWTEIINWLDEPTGKVKLVDDVMPDFYYLGEVQAAPTIEEKSVYSTITIVFQCYPYRFRHADTTDEWDPFMFDLDVAQNTEFDVDHRLEIMLVNACQASVPLTIDASSEMVITTGDLVYDVAQGKTKESEIVLMPGENKLIIEGSGHIAFDWYEKVI
ncbi:phage tail domain-containing protein [Ligilactobacillus acidipiscis]|uniref:phage tail domain-containing protein n=1 Tax=Ligilactobacillus acidipiscis TaxID=89059 RepID=UPI0023F9078A|nr:phage tail domain-containing protein [Ligilactobacillus acidipiscis]WEV56126.1 phage tail family protein [Ligilactobacillus acidipiscis]